MSGLPPRSSFAGLCGADSQRGSSGSFPPLPFSLTPPSSPAPRGGRGPRPPGGVECRVAGPAPARGAAGGARTGLSLTAVGARGSGARVARVSVSCASRPLLSLPGGTCWPRPARGCPGTAPSAPARAVSHPRSSPEARGWGRTADGRQAPPSRLWREGGGHFPAAAARFPSSSSPTMADGTRVGEGRYRVSCQRMGVCWMRVALRGCAGPWVRL